MPFDLKNLGEKENVFELLASLCKEKQYKQSLNG